MIPSSDDDMAFRGSSTLLWPLFLVLGLSQLVETISTALQGRQPLSETGMSVFEHSLASAEAEAVVKSSIKLPDVLRSSSPQTSSSTPVPKPTPDPQLSKPFAVTNEMILHRLNLPPEILVISLISACSHMSSQMLGVFDIQARFRLINTTIWGTLYIGLLTYSLIAFARPPDLDEMYLVRYPTVCIIAFIPHALALVAILVCAIMYTIAIFSTILSTPNPNQGRTSFSDRVKLAQENLQASSCLANFKIRWHEDFYTTLLKAGYTVMSAATEAVYFNEGVSVNLNNLTWLEQKRYDELIQYAGSKPGHKRRPLHGTNVPVELQDNFAEGGSFGLFDAEYEKGAHGESLRSGYARERKTTKDVNKTGLAATKETGIGLAQRSGRLYMSWKLIRESFSLVGFYFARILVNSLDGEPPRWLQRLARVPQQGNATKPVSAPGQKTLDFWMISDTGELIRPHNSNVDVEAETRKRLEMNGNNLDLDSNLYSWWKSNGWWGDVDSSGDYQPPSSPDDDTTSVLSGSTAWETDDETDGMRTPTQSQFNGGRETTPEFRDTSQNLARLLDPRTLEDRQEAKILSHHLRSSTRPLTRAEFRRRVLREKTQILTPSHSTSSGVGTPSNTESSDKEETLLEQIILSRRAANTSSSSSSTEEAAKSWKEGGEGMGAGGPQCAICRCSPRTILVWPCRCLSLCEDCRVNLAWNNFGNCVCCRRDVVAYSRLYVP